ncbi:MAG: hypothetical protein HQK52_18785 [Oligoflexia bacterium]|nr:hypothetical protein [Oligoflexia bacterium]
MKSLVFMMAVLFIFYSSFLVSANAAGWYSKPTDFENEISKHLIDIDLDEKQQDFINDLKSKVMKETIKISADIDIAQIEIKDLLRQKSVDIKTIEAKLRQIEMMNTEINLSQIKAIEECKNRLTPGQRKQWK